MSGICTAGAWRESVFSSGQPVGEHVMHRHERPVRAQHPLCRLAPRVPSTPTGCGMTVRRLRTVLAAVGVIPGIALSLALLSATTLAQTAGPVVLRDDLQREISLPRPPQRVISMLPSLTETVCELGACTRLVATDRYSDWPERVKKLPKTGGLDDAQIELIVSLRPDLVLLSRSQRITDRLQELGIVSFALNTQSYADIQRNIQIISELLGKPERASGLSQFIERAIRDIGAQAIARRHGAGPSVYFEVDQAPYAAGPNSFIGELLTRLGTRNIVTPELGPYPRLNPEYVVRHNPDVIFISSTEADRIATRPGWDQIRAVKERRLCSFSAKVGATLIRPGPRVAEGMSAMADCLARVAP